MTDKGLTFLAAEMTLGASEPAALPGAALRALEAGLDSPGLRTLAGLSRAELGEAAQLFGRVLVELELPLMTPRDAVMLLARVSAADLASGRVTPYEAAKRIWELTLRVPDIRLPELDPFIYAASEWADRPHDHELFSKGILREAQGILSA